MDYRKDMRTPKDRVDDELLARLLRETDELIAGCGCRDGYESVNDSRRSNRQTRRNRDGICGCGENRRDRRNDGGCGCSENRRDRRNDGGCGFGENRRDRRNDGGCGCGENSNGYQRTDECSPSGCSNEREAMCECINRGSLSIQTQGLPLVMSYAPDHEFHELYEDEEALKMGTLFRPLNFPFYPVKCTDNCSCGRQDNRSNKCGKDCGCGE